MFMIGVYSKCTSFLFNFELYLMKNKADGESLTANTSK